MFEPPPSEMTTSSQQGPAMIVLDDTDDVSPPLNKTKNDPLHVRARKLLNTIIARGAAGPLPIPVPKTDNHLPSTRYYGGDSVSYKYQDDLPHLMSWHLGKTIALPVDQDLVKKAMDGEHFIYFINVPSYKLIDVLRTIIMAGSRSPPIT